MNIEQIGLGTAALGRPQYINIRKDAPPVFEFDSFKSLGREVFEAAYQSGIRYYDTAPGYGLAEELLLNWVKEKNDPEIEVATKWGYIYTANFNPKAKVHEVKDHSVEVLTRQWSFSEKLLPHLSTLQIHSATFETGVLKNKAVLEKLAEISHEFGIRIGLTTTGHNQVEVLKEALDVSINNKPLFEVFQVTFNILDQSLMQLKDLLHDGEKRIVIKEGVANGRIFPNKRYPAYHKMYRTLENMAKKYKVGIDALTLQFCQQTIEPFKVLSGAWLPYQLHENMKAVNFELSAMDVKTMQNFAIDPKQYWRERKQLPWN